MIHVEPTFDTIHKICNELKVNASSKYTNLGRGTQIHFGHVLTGAQYTIIYQITTIYPTPLGPLTILTNTNAAITTVMRDTHTEDLIVLRKFMGVKKDLFQYIIAALDEAYLVDIRDCTTIPINMPVPTFSITSKTHM